MSKLDEIRALGRPERFRSNDAPPVTPPAKKAKPAKAELKADLEAAVADVPKGKRKPMLITLSAEHLEALDAYRKREGIDNRSDAIRRLIEESR